jgi:hypothetical protein
MKRVKAHKQQLHMVCDANEASKSTYNRARIKFKEQQTQIGNIASDK